MPLANSSCPLLLPEPHRVQPRLYGGTAEAAVRAGGRKCRGMAAGRRTENFFKQQTRGAACFQMVFNEHPRTQLLGMERTLNYCLKDLGTSSDSGIY